MTVPPRNPPVNPPLLAPLLPPCRRFRSATARFLAAALAALLAPAGQAQSPSAPSQRPLLHRSGAGVKPNIMLTMDVSGSMRAQFMPEGDLILPGGWRVPSPPGTSKSPTFHPDDIPAAGTVPTHPEDSAAWTHRFLRAPQTNTLYYSPEVRYLPWVKQDGSRYPAADPRRAVLDPMQDKPATVNLAFTGHVRAQWCLFQPQLPGFTPEGLPAPPYNRDCPSATMRYSAAMHFRLLKDSGGAYRDPRQADSYRAFDLNADASTTYEKFPARTDCAGARCTRDEELKNFAHWFVYHRTRMHLAKSALGEVLQGLEDQLRLGYGRTNQWLEREVDGIKLRIVESGVRDYDARRRTQVMDWLYGLEPDGTTPLRLAVQEVGRYYESAATGGPWSDTPGQAAATGQAQHQACRRAYHVLVTDGYWNDSVGSMLKAVGNVDGQPGADAIRDEVGGRDWRYDPTAPYQDDQADRLADYAMHFWSRDLRPDLPNVVLPSRADPATWQHMVNFTVGLGVRGMLDPASDGPALQAGTLSWGTDKVDDLWHAAVNSRGTYASAHTTAQLKGALQGALRSAYERELLEAGVATTASTLDTPTRKYVPRYRSGEWSGDVEAYELDAKGQAKATPLWTAGERLPAWRARKVYTWDAGTAPPQGTDFDWDALSASTRDALDPRARSAGFLHFLRGDRSGESAATGWRVRASLLGDFIHSAPVFVKGASEAGHLLLPGKPGASYPAWLKAKAARPGMLYVGGNAGMLHAFRDKTGAAGSGPDGAEVFAYVPRATFPRLHLLGQQDYGTAANFHRFYVDGPLREADVYVPAPGGSEAGWRNYLFGTTGVGARAVFALDITDPEDPSPAAVRWEVSDADDPELGHVTAPVASGQLPNGEWVALFGNGLGGSSGRPYLFVVHLATRAVTKLLVDPAATGSGLGGVGVRKDAQGRIVALYAGDLAGNLWRLDYDADAESRFKVGQGGAAVFRHGPTVAGQPPSIVQPPLVFNHRKGGWLVVFGTGRLFTQADADDTSPQAVYGIWDRPADPALAATPPIGLADLATRRLAVPPTDSQRSQPAFVEVTGDAIDWGLRRGWMLELDGLAGYEGLRVLYPVQAVRDRVVLVGAVVPGSASKPGAGSTGKGLNLLLPVDSGAAPDQPYFDTTGDGVFDTRDRRVSGYLTRADGRDAIVFAARRAPATGSAAPPAGEVAARPACEGFLAHLVGGYASQTACLPGHKPIVARLWRRVLAVPF